ncbi:hypothetical protein Ancab_027607 [Ancistrocladus abbreviatus]
MASIASTSPPIRTDSPSPFPPPISLLHRRQFRNWRCRKLKRHPQLAVCNQLHPSLPPLFDNVFQNFLSHLPHPLNSLNFLPATALGFASGLALSLSSRWKKDSKLRVSDVGEWILFTSPTPFNRFVVLRCPSISFDGSEFLEDVNEKLIKEDRHYVRIDSGRIQVRDSGEDSQERKLEYQRVCVGTDDGGVITLDWPADLELSEEHGLDTTVLVVPGTPEGSMDETVRGFVNECLKRGFFPVVMNPRGCAGSPLTTARLFTAADSDDISSAIQFISRARPWCALMAVGRGYGANMLTKYLAEVGEKTPLTAAICINNPFDLEEATGIHPYQNAVNQKLTGGLIDILKSNKGLFQGRRKGFDVEKAISAESLRDFEKAISMVSYGFSTIEEFYSKSSTRSVVGNVKIPVLFVQNDDGTVPLFSIPRGLIAENPFTSLLLCTSLPSNITVCSRSVISWCQQLTIEWLSAVELGLLKGRHPLLKDVDVTIKPSKGLALMEGRTSDASDRSDSALSFTQLDSSSGYFSDPMKEKQVKNDTAAAIHIGSGHGWYKNRELDDNGLGGHNGSRQRTSSIDALSAKADDGNPVESSSSQVLQSAQVVVNMLDVTMPGALTEEEKKKVLSAVEQGETLIKALQDAMPEDVRGKLTNSVTEIIEAQGKNLNFNGLLGIPQRANVSSGLKLEIDEKVGKKIVTPTGSGGKDHHYSDQKMDSGEGPGDNEAHAGGADVESDGAVSQENPLKSSDVGESEPLNSNGEVVSAAGKGFTESQNNQDSLEPTKKKAAKVSEFDGNNLETGAMTSTSDQCDKPFVSEEVSIKPETSYQYGKTDQHATEGENNVSEKDRNYPDSSKDPNKTTSSPAGMDEALSQLGSSDVQLLAKEDEHTTNKHKKIMQPILNQSKPSSDSDASTFSVSEALDALTGLDNSTQAAVNSVFGVIEEMISQLEEGQEDKSKAKHGNGTMDDNNGSDLERMPISDEHQSEMPVDGKDLEEVSPSVNIVSSIRNQNEDPLGLDRNRVAGVGNKLVGTNAVQNADFKNFPSYITTNAYGEFFCNEYLRKYILSMMQKAKPLDLDTTTALFLDYIPEEGQWKMLEQPGTITDSDDGAVAYGGLYRKGQATSHAKSKDADNIIEPSYVILDSDRQQEPLKEFEGREKLDEKVMGHGDGLEELTRLVKNIVLDSLEVEVCRRLSAADMKEMEPILMGEIEEVANTMSLAVRSYKESTGYFIDSGIDPNINQPGRFFVESCTKAIFSAVKNTSYLRRVLPVGVIVGSCLASLRKHFNVALLDENHHTEILDLNQDYISSVKLKDEAAEVPADRSDPSSIPGKQSNKNSGSTELKTVSGKGAGSRILNRDTVMVGAVTAALGASALLAHQQDACNGNDINETSCESSEKKGFLKDSAKLEETMADKHQNIVTSLAEKAMTVAAPVVPTKEDGEVDQERLVAMLAELGQRIGMLKLVGKIALLWGGMRGAMSLTDRLISFLRIAERPLFQRILGFVCMVLVLWSPVVVPLLPKIVQNWATQNSSRTAELACIVGLYTAVTILIMLWGKRIRGYENPLKQYGLDLRSSHKVQEFVIGLLGGVILVLLIHSINAVLGCVCLCWPESLGSSSDVIAKVKAYGQLFILAGRGFATATCVAFVEELLFRSWLPEEIAIDLGYYPGIIISGLAFSWFQRSLQAIPGLWLLSLWLAGVQQRKQGSLYIPVGLRTGIMTSSFMLQMGGFLIYSSEFPVWVTGTHPFQPFSGVVGLLVSLLLAISLSPRQPSPRKKVSRTTRE